MPNSQFNFKNNGQAQKIDSQTKQNDNNTKQKSDWNKNNGNQINLIFKRH